MQLKIMQSDGSNGVSNTQNIEQILNSSPENEAQKVKVHFCKDNVFIYPSTKEGIPGIIYILEKANREFFLAWTPNYMLEEHKGKQEAHSSQSDLYAVQVPLKEVHSIKRYTPSLKVHHIIIVSESGIAFPPYYFNSGGMREFWNALRARVNLVRSDEDQNTFYTADLDEPMSLLRSSLDKDKAALLRSREGQSLSGPVSANAEPDSEPKSEPKSELKSEPNSAIVPSRAPQAKHQSTSSNSNLSWTLLENFSKVTQFARQAAGIQNNILNNLDTQIRDFENRVFSPKKSPISSPKTTPNSESLGQNAAHTTTLGTFELVDDVQNQPKVERTKELSAEEWMMFFDEEGRIKDESEIRKRIFHGGVEPSIRMEVWKYLLNMYPFTSTFKEREEINQKRRKEYFQWKNTWQFVLNDPDCRWDKFKSRCHNIEKDVVRTDRTLDFYADENGPNLKMLNEILITYTFYNYDLGYVQGMNELLSPILFVMGADESDSYWCFKGVMDVMEGNFHKDQNGMRIQLNAMSKMIQVLDSGLHEYLREHDALNMFFCFRWILIIFKREFSFFTIQRLWEVLWSNHLTPNFHFYIAAAILLRHRQEFIDKEMQFDDMVKYVNELAGKLHLEELLVDAEQTFYAFQRLAPPDLKNELNQRRPRVTTR
eukprot:TRINITY_DN9425_c0_g1_i1.p1 TRINITY_DN9425_c0_g1~~TRINITY_DN9425_c0_g1_i1.p1  ORF type:complete len:655 (+),score=177.99 TRINITY_DN9425_c0_g1_i1:169-2133(+)